MTSIKITSVHRRKLAFGGVFVFFANSFVALGAAAPNRPKIISYRVVGTWPHDPTAFTQGLEVWGHKYFLETTGMYGHSEIRKVDIKTGVVVARKSLDAKYFGEGATRVGSDIYQLTWKEGVLLKWSFSDKKGFDYKSQIPWQGEGWGMTNGGGALWVSNGTSELQKLDPKTLKVTRIVKVMLEGQPLDKINELEYVDGVIYANVWMTSTIVGIHPETGAINRLIDLKSVTPKQMTTDAVANGIAWDSGSKHLYVTGKLWPSVFELEIQNILK